MSRVRLAFRKQLEAIARRVQQATVARLLGGRTVSGAPVEPKDGGAGGVPGVRTGQMLRDLLRHGNATVRELGFKIVQPAATAVRWVVFNAGARPTAKRPGGQPARPVGGISAAEMDQAARELARAGRDQIVSAMRESRGGRGR